jgi:hypothetical protein
LFESQYYINKVGDVAWVYLTPDRNMWKAELDKPPSDDVKGR